MSSTLVNISPSPKKKPWYRSPKVLRHGVMAFFFLFLLHVAYDHQIKGGGPRGTPSVEAYCPFGGLESLYQFLTTGGFIRRIEPSTMILFAALLILTLVASRGFCGWMCPFGSVQEWLGMLGKKIFRRKYNPTGRWDRALRYMKYVILAVIIALTWHLGALVFRDYDPFLAFFHLGAGMDELPWAYAILGVVLVGSLFIERFFCKYACPLGAVLAIIGKVGLTRIQRDPTDCKSCNLCHQKCHAHVEFLSATTIRDAECNHCLDCVVDCPQPNVLTVRGPKLRFSHTLYASMLVAGLFLLIGTSKLAGKWQTRPEVVAFTDNRGKLTPENIRGWMTLEDISKGYRLPLERLYSAAGIPSRIPPDTRLNMVAKTYHVDLEPERVRDLVGDHLAGKPLQPALATEMKTEAPKPALQTPAPKKEHKQADTSGSEPEVKGFMTLNEIALKTGVPKEHILKALGLPADMDGRAPVREWMHDHGKTIQDLRDAVAQYRQGKR